MALLSSYDTIGQAEDVSDIISNITPSEVPFTTMIKKGKTSAKLYEWQEDSLAAAAENAHVEGADFTDATLTPTTMRSQYTQIMEKTIKISATSDAVKTYGRAKETAYQMAKKMKELKRDVEFGFIGQAQNAVAGDDTSVARQFASAFGTDPSSNALINSAVYDLNGGTPRALDEATFLDVLEACYSEGADPTVFMIKPADSRIVAGWTGSAGRTRQVEGGSKTITNVVNLYVSPFGEVKVSMNRNILATAALLVHPDMWESVTLRPFTRELLAKTGDAEKHVVVGEISLKHKNYKGTGYIGDLS